MLDAIKRLNFVPWQRSRQFRPGRTRAVGLIVANLDNPLLRRCGAGGREAVQGARRRVGDDRDCWSVVVDDLRGGQSAARHLVERGHRRIAYLGHPDKSPKVRTRLAGGST